MRACVLAFVYVIVFLCVLAFGVGTTLGDHIPAPVSICVLRVNVSLSM